MIGIGLRFITVPTARAARGLPACAASAPYVVVVPYSTRASSSSTSRLYSGSEPHVELDVEVPAPAREVLVELAVHPLDRLRRAEHARAELPCERVELMLRLGVEADPADAAVGDADEQRPDRRVVEARRRRRRAARPRPRPRGSARRERGRRSRVAPFAAGGRRPMPPVAPPARSSRARRRSRRSRGRSRSAARRPRAPSAAGRRSAARDPRRPGRPSSTDELAAARRAGLARRASSTTIRLAIVKTHARRCSPCSSRG